MQHSGFASGYPKVTECRVLLDQIVMFREYGMGSFRDLLVRLSMDPAMIMWLDNDENHAGAINENYGRELLELFSMGVGNYSEQDIKECARAFTGWTVANTKYMKTMGERDSLWPYGRVAFRFEFRAEDHDDGEKTCLGHTGDLNGEDIIEILADQEATPRFLARHLYNFFVADEAQVPAWNITPPRDPEAIEALVKAYNESDGDIRTMLRVLFKSDFFKSARFEHVKSPAELVVSTVRMAGNYNAPRPGLTALAMECNWQGQELLNPPSVESWHTGSEWIDGGALVRRVNFAAGLLGDTSLPGVRSVVGRIESKGSLAPGDFVSVCLDALGPLEVSESTHGELLAQAQEGGNLSWGTEDERSTSEKRVGIMLALIAASRDYQFA